MIFRLHRLLIFILLTVYGGLALHAQSKAETDIRALEQRRFEAMIQKDVAFLEEVLAENVTYAHSNGLVENKQQHLDNVSSGNITYQSMKVEESDIRTYRKTIVINGKIRVKGLYKGTPFDILLGFTDVYVKRKRKWQLVAWQSVKIER